MCRGHGTSQQGPDLLAGRGGTSCRGSLHFWRRQRRTPLPLRVWSFGASTASPETPATCPAARETGGITTMSHPHYPWCTMQHRMLLPVCHTQLSCAMLAAAGVKCVLSCWLTRKKQTCSAPQPSMSAGLASDGPLLPMPMTSQVCHLRWHSVGHQVNSCADDVYLHSHSQRSRKYCIHDGR